MNPADTITLTDTRGDQEGRRVDHTAIQVSRDHYHRFRRFARRNQSLRLCHLDLLHLLPHFCRPEEN